MDYDSNKAINWSSLKLLHESPLMYKWRLDHPEPMAPHFLIGSAIHCRVLEPDEFDKRYALCELKRDKRHKVYQTWLHENKGKEALSAEEWDHVQRSGDAVWGHDVAKDVLTGCRHEEPMTWVDPDTGLKCKGRVDSISPDYVVDLKTTTDPSPRRFTLDATKYCYHGQLGGMYHTGAIATKKIAGDEPPFFIALGKEPPYDVAVYQMKPDGVAAGRRLVLQLMEKLQQCIAADLWPGVAPDLQYLELPNWAPGFDNTEVDW